MPVYPSGGTIAQSAGSPGFGPAPTPSFNASASVRLNPADTAYFSYTPTLQGSRTTWTWSGWVKRSALGTPNYQELFGTPNGTSNTTFCVLTFGSNNVADTLGFQVWTTVYRVTTQVFRDPAQWYHILCAVDTTQSTGANRVKLYVNGTQVTAFSTSNDPAQFTQLPINAAGAIHTIGRDLSQSVNFGGYLADVNFVDGLALTPSSFTATDANTGQLVPAQYTGSFGTNGFYLPLSGAALAVDLGQNPKTTAQDFPYWPYNTLLVDTTSTNGAQNNTFLDSSTNNFTITRNGNTTQGNFTPFNYGGGTTQANGYYSGYFDGTGDYLNQSTNRFLDGSTWTVEGWVYTSDTAATIAAQYVSSGGQFSSRTILGISSNLIYIFQAGSSVSGTTNISNNQWYHIAYVRNGSTVKAYVNGRLEATFSGFINPSLTTTTFFYDGFNSGQEFLGYFSNLRVTTTEVYTSNFTPPTSPLTAITGTALLTCQSSQFIDNSANAFTITVNGNPQPLPTNPFGMTAWSGYFDGTGDYLTFPELNIPASTSFTIEFFVSWNAVPSTLSMFISEDGGSASKYLTYNNNGTLQAQMGGSAATVASCPFSLASNVWYHIAFVRNVNTVTIYVNGVAQTMTQATQSGAFLDVGTINYIGRWGGSPEYAFNGQMSNFRAVVGTAVYTSNFTPPTAPLTAITNTQLLTCQSSTFIDNSPSARAITVFGNSYTGTLNNPFNNPINYTTPPVQAWSNYFDGAGDSVVFPNNANYALGTNNFTFECWVYSVATGNCTVINYSNGVSSNANFSFELYQVSPTQIQFSVVSGTTGYIASNSSFKTNQWVHIAAVRNGGTLQIYNNGILAGSVSVAGVTVSAPAGSTLRFGLYTNGGGPYTGYISNARIVNGRALYTSNFTPPTGPLTAVPNTVVLTCQSNRFVDNSIVNAVPTVGGNAFISSLSPFIPTQAWSAASYGGSMYFDGTGDYLSIADNATLEFGSSDFTIEAFIYPTATVGANRPIWSHGTNSTNWMSLYLHTTAGRPEFVIISGGSTIVDIWPADVISPNIWYHLAVTRSGSTFRMFLNGALIGTGTNASAVPDYTDDYRVGYGRWSGDTGVYAGNISGLRILKGTSLYTGPFVPPALPLTNITNTSLLLNATNSGIYDSTGQNVIETVGNAQVTTAVKKFGESSISFDGSGDYLIMAATQAATAQFGTADFTVEGWFYPTNVTTLQVLIGNRVAASGANNWDMAINASSKINWGTTSTNYLTSSTSVLVNTWQHIAVCRVSGTTRLFLNGVLEATTTSSINLSANSQLNIGNQGTYSPTSYNYIGYMQDIRITKGVGRYAGNFTPPAAAFAYNQYDICNQQWTPTNLSVTAGVNQDNLVDSPSDFGTDTGLGGQVRGNYCTWNPLKNSTTLSNGNLSSVNASTTQWLGVSGTFGVTSGKWYWECTPITAAVVVVGLANSSYNTGGHPGADANSWGYFSNSGNKYFNAAASAYGASFTTNDVIGVAFDADVGTLTFYKNGVSQGVAFSGLTSGPYFPACGVLSSSNLNINAGQRAFSYTAPSGFKCLVSTNLPTTNGIGATSSTQATDYFNTVIYTGNDVSGRTITGVGFQPDFVWIKARNQAYSNQVTDVVRGPSKALLTNSTTAELTNRTVGYVSAFASDGFTVTAGSSDSAEVNQSGTTYVAWNWKANGAGVANTAGTIPSTVSANTTNGVSIVTYTSQSSGSGTIGHGLGVAPAMIINKPLTGSVGWSVYHQSLGNLAGLGLNSTAGLTSSPTYWNSTSPTTTVFSQGSAFAGLGTMVAYCFANVPGFSSLGSFTANSSADNAFVYTGFAPRFIMVKVTTAGTNGNWVIFDTARNPTNIVGFEIYPNSNAAEAYSADLDILSNGFKLRNAGFVSGIWIYAAFAEFPFKYSRAR